MLRLASSTSPSWIGQALEQPDLVLLDHAHCEKKAASTALSLIFRYVDRPGLAEALSPYVREELEHFERVLGVLRRRGVSFRALAPSGYATRLHAEVRRQEPHRLLDTLLICGLIEARSCERMTLLATHMSDPELRSLYGDLLASEARHHQIFVDLALRWFDETEVRSRLQELAQHEATCFEPGEPLRVHS